MAIGKKTGGRQKGTKNKHSFNAEELANEMGCDPLRILLSIALGDWKALGYDNEVYFSENAQGATKMGYTITPEMRLKAAQEACKYLYSQKKSVEVSTVDGSGIQVVVHDYTQKKPE
jgi:hypothetical protein